MHDKQFAYDFHYPTSKQQKLCHRFASCRSQMLFLSHPPPYALQQYLVANRPPNCVLHLTIYGLFLALPSDDDVVGRHSVYVVQFRSLAGTNDLYLLPSIIRAPSVAISKQATIHHPHCTRTAAQLKRRWPSNFHDPSFAFFPNPFGSSK